MDDIDALASQAAERILPEHFDFNEIDSWYTCPAHPGFAHSRDKGTDCDCGLNARRLNTEAIIKEVLEEYGSIVRSAHETASNS